jgi:hypothetical protein
MISKKLGFRLGLDLVMLSTARPERFLKTISEQTRA